MDFLQLLGAQELEGWAWCLSQAAPRSQQALWGALDQPLSTWPGATHVAGREGGRRRVHTGTCAAHLRATVALRGQAHGWPWAHGITMGMLHVHQHVCCSHMQTHWCAPEPHLHVVNSRLRGPTVAQPAH